VNGQLITACLIAPARSAKVSFTIYSRYPPGASRQTLRDAFRARASGRRAGLSKRRPGPARRFPRSPSSDWGLGVISLPKRHLKYVRTLDFGLLGSLGAKPDAQLRETEDASAQTGETKRPAGRIHIFSGAHELLAVAGGRAPTIPRTRPGGR
jgi:hypothetical protein